MASRRYTETMVVTNTTENLPKVREFVRGMAARSSLRSDEENKVILAVDEAVANIIEHAYTPDDGAGTIEVEVQIDENSFIATIRDTGVRFNPKSVDDIDIEEHVRTGKKKGLGIFLMRRIMDEVIYQFKEGVKNELRLVKYID